MKVVKIPSEKLSPSECFSGVNRAYWTLKYAYINLETIQEQLRAEANYELSDKLRDILKEIERAYSYKLGNIKD